MGKYMLSSERELDTSSESASIEIRGGRMTLLSLCLQGHKEAFLGIKISL